MSKTVKFIFSTLLILIVSAFTLLNNEQDDYVQIGDLKWTSNNCVVDEFANGDDIPQAKTHEEWKDAYLNKKPVWCYFNYSEAFGSYGKLYNFPALIDKRGLAPKGYRLAHRKDWDNLIKALGGSKNASFQIKSIQGWKFDKNGSNSSGFNCQPFGFYQTVSADNLETDNFNGVGFRTEFWALHIKSKKVYGHLIQVHGLQKMNFDKDTRGAGAYVRLIKL